MEEIFARYEKKKKIGVAFIFIITVRHYYALRSAVTNSSHPAFIFDLAIT